MCLLEASAWWLGGQYSAQGVSASRRQPVHALGWKHRRLPRVPTGRSHTLSPSSFTLSPAGTAQKAFNPGGVDGGFATGPAVAHDVLLQQLQLPNVHVRLYARVTAAAVQGTSIASVTAVDGNGVQTVFEAKYFLDATDLGELLHSLSGRGIRARRGKPRWKRTKPERAAGGASRLGIQPITVVAALERRPDGEVHTIGEPANYQALKAQQRFAVRSDYVKTVFQTPADLWGYRRYIAAAEFPAIRRCPTT